MSRRQAYYAVDRFEAALSEYTGAPIVVCTDTCTNAIFLALAWWKERFGLERVDLPSHNYVGVPQACRNLGIDVEWTDHRWSGLYWLSPTNIVDSAKRFHRRMYTPQTLTCVSFGASKRLNIGRGGAILLDNQGAADWIRPRLMDGRTPGEDYKKPSFVRPAWRMNMTPEQAARGLELLTYLDDDDREDWTEYPNLAEADWR